MKKPIVTYRRVASPETSTSDMRQRKALQDHLDRISENAVEEFVDVGVAGNRVERAGLDALIQYCDRHPGTLVLVESPVRIARNTGVYIEIVGRLAASGAEIGFANGQ